MGMISRIHTGILAFTDQHGSPGVDLFTGSIVENIAYGRPDATGPEILEASKNANADEFIAKMPDGYYTLLGERGSNLSGGQRQRIAIARAFIRDTPIPHSG